MSRSLHTPAHHRLRAVLIDARAEANLTQIEVAKKLKKPQSFVSKYENGERNLDVLEFAAVCRALGISACDVLKQLQA